MLNITNAADSLFDSDTDSLLTVDHLPEKPKTPQEQLFQHIQNVNLEEVKKLLSSKKSKVNVRDANRRTALHEAVHHNQTKIAKFLLKLKANVNAQDTECISPLHEAVRNDNIAMVKLLLSYQAKVNVADNCGVTPLHDAASNKNLSIVKTLIDHGANVNVPDKDFNTPLYEAACHNYTEAIELLLKCGADPNCKNDGNYEEFSSAFYQVLLTGNEKAINLFLDYGVNVNLKQYCNETALHLAVVHSNVEIVKKLLVKGVKVKEITEHDLETALHWLLHYHSNNPGDECAITDKIAILVRHGINVNAHDKVNKTALNYAVERKLDVKVIGCLLEHGANVNGFGGNVPIATAVRNGDLHTVRFLLENKSKVDHVDKEKRCNLYHAIDCIEDDPVRYEMASVLLDNGANANSCRSPEILTPLQLAIRRHDLRLVQLLIDSGALINPKFTGQESPLCTAVKYNFYEAAEIFISLGASVHVYSKKGKSLFSIAKSNKNEDMEALLMKCLNNKTSDGE